MVFQSNPMDFISWYSPSQAFATKHVSYPRLTATGQLIYPMGTRYCLNISSMSSGCRDTNCQYKQNYYLDVFFQASIISWLPSVVFSVLAFIAAGLVLILPETLGRPLPQSIAEVHLYILVIGLLFTLLVSSL